MPSEVCKMSANIATLLKGQQELEKQTTKLFAKDEERLHEIKENEKNLAVMHEALEEVRAEVHTVRGDIDDLKKAAASKAEVDRLFQIEMKQQMHDLTEMMKKPKEEKVWHKDPKAILGLAAIVVVGFVSMLLIVSGNADQVTDTIKAIPKKGIVP